MPLGWTLLHALRLAAKTSSDASATWLTLNGLDAACAPVRALAGLLNDEGRVAPPGNSVPWLYEQGLLEALARVDREPDQAEKLLAFLPPARRIAGMALLAELSRCISQDLAARLKSPDRNFETRPASA